MKFKKWLNKVTKIFVVLGMVLSMCFTAGNTNTVEAWDSGIPHEFTRIKSITYPEWWKRKCPQITKQWSTYMCKYNGQWSYCLEASKRTPSSGNYAANVINNNVMVRKFLYYGFGGPAQCLFKGQALKDDGLNEAETGYLYTHVLLSLAYSGDMCGANIDDLERAGIGLKSTWQYVEGLPDPSNGANFSTGDTASLKATFDKANMIQTTNIVSFNASSNETVQLPLQSNVTIHIAGSSAQQTGGTATVWGGQSFYLTAPLENSPTDYTSGTLNSSAKGKFCALAISDGNGSNQTHGSWTQESVDSLRYSVDWLDFGWIDLIKKSANEGITNNNGCYSLEGAVYGIYSDGVKVDEITTDKNGYASTSAEWNKHTANTNRGETSEDGIWFGTSKPDDSKGALIYDTYILEEHRCETNEGMNLLKIEVEVYRNHVVIDMGTLTDDRITIGTTALDKDTESHLSKPEEKITIIDTVEYEGLKKGQSYKLLGTLMDKETGKPIEVDGKPVTAETTFKPKKTSGSTEVKFTFDATSLRGKTIVVFEELYQDDLKLAVHTDIEDEDQTIYFPEIKTTAKDAHTDSNLSLADKEVTLVDTVTYKNLLPGKEYVMTGTLMDKETGEAVVIDDKKVTAETTFTPETAEGTVDVQFTFDGSTLAGKTVVVFESVSYEGKEFAVHADLKDEGQTIYFPEIKTTAKDNVSGNHYAKPEKEITLIDTVSYQNLIPGKEYTLTGTLMDKETKKPLEADGKPITAQTTFTPEKADGNVELSFTFDASALRGKTIVVFESVSYKEKEIAVHADIDDHEQSIYFPEIKTTAKDGADDDKEVLSSKEATIIDTVTYKNLIPKAKYKLVGILMDKETGKAILVNKKTVTAETEFSPKESDGSVDVTFTFDASELNGHDVVVFEKLFLLDGDVETEITSHEDIKDEGQTVKLTETPKEPPKTTPPVKTGDDTTLLPFIILAGTALLTAIGFGVLYFKKRKK